MFLLLIWVAYCVQDFSVSSKNIMQLWQAGKMSHESCKEELVKSRGSGLQSCYAMVEFVESKEKSVMSDVQIEVLGNQLRSKMLAFKSHPDVDDWKRQYDPHNFGKLVRYKILLLVGKSRSGKTQFAKSLFGNTQTMVLNCQGLGTAIPSLREVNRAVHCCIVFDEVCEKQVLDNKVLFQAGIEKVALAQSRCGGFRYDIWPYGLAMILCSNTFLMTVQDGLEGEDDEDWLRANIVVVERKVGDLWYEAHHQIAGGQAHAGS